MIDHEWIDSLLHRAGIPNREISRLRDEFIVWLHFGFRADELAIAFRLGKYGTQIVPRMVIVEEEPHP